MQTKWIYYRHQPLTPVYQIDTFLFIANLDKLRQITIFAFKFIIMIELPPHITTPIDTSNDTEELKDLISSINSLYLYWSDVKYRMPSGMTDIELWGS